jgi:hypothetical protein
MHVSPASYIAGILAAQRRDQKLDEFLDGAIAAACADDDDSPDRLLPWGPHAMDLFLQLADTVPEALRGPWKVLYAKVLNDPSLWTVPEAMRVAAVWRRSCMCRSATFARAQARRHAAASES